MPTVELRLPGGRYHATPWGHHVNEGLVEWPPSPWRLLRALIATGFSKLGWRNVPPVAKQMIDKLAAVLPLYFLPAASAAHSRHYMPIKEGRNQKPTLVFDTWANVGTGKLLIHWPCELDIEEIELLDKLACSLGYLGRSESWVEAKLTDKVAEWNAVPCQKGVHCGPGWEQVSLMAAIPPADYQTWQKQQEEVALARFPLPDGRKKPTAKLRENRARAVEPYPPDLLSCLTKDTAWWKGHGWSQPPGSRRVLYWRRSDALQVGVPMVVRRHEPPSVECMLLAVTSPSGNRSALPHVSRTLPQAEHLRRALICRAADGSRIHCPSLLGRDESGPLQDHHSHAHFIPLDLDGDQHLDHILIYAPARLCGTAQRAVRSLKRTWTKGGVGDLQLAVVGAGDRDSLRRISRFGARIEAILGRPVGGRVWRSATPFVPPRFLKTRGKNSLVGQVHTELASRCLPAAQEVRVDMELTRELRHFIRARTRGGTRPPIDAGFGVQLVFTQSVSGPLALGYASHFGLGLFINVDEC